MKNLLQIEWMKVKNYRTFWILLGLYIAAVLGINYISYQINTEINKNIPMGEMLMGGPFAYPRIWQSISWMSSWLLYFPGFIVILLVSNEYTFKTHRQNIIDGLSRKQFVTTKLAVGFILAVLATVLTSITTVVFGLVSNSSFTLEGFSAIGYFFICSWVYVLFALLLAFLFRKAVLAIGIFFIFGLILDNLLVSLIRWLLHGKPYGSYFSPIDVADSLLPHPFRNLTDKGWEAPDVTICFIICCAWIVFYHWFINRKFQAEDL